MAYELLDIEPVQKWDRKNKFYREMRIWYTFNGIEYYLDISMEDYEAGKADELVRNEIERMEALLGKKK